MPRALTSRASAGFHVRLVFRLCSTLKRLLIHRGTMAWLLKSHNGVHCCGTVGDSHSHSQLSTATCTSQGGVCVSDPHCKGTTIFRPHQTFSRKNLFNSPWRSFPLALAPAVQLTQKSPAYNCRLGISHYFLSHFLLNSLSTTINK